MLIIPAVDIKDGKVVRLTRGEFDSSKVYGDDPVAMAGKWAGEGAELIHVVDLDGALLGKPSSTEAIKRIAKSVKVDIEVGGGLRDLESIAELLDAGVKRVVLGTRALDKLFVEEALKKFTADKIVVGLDVKDGRVAAKGWIETSEVKPVDVATAVEEAGVKTIIYTDIQRDGTMAGPNVKAMEELCDWVGMEIIASGGISSLSDLLELKRLEKKGVVGAIVGRSLYEGRFLLKDAITACN
ncbi:MAG: 1-(5-phosphoribosyl)-5-[(5-phosphoribosylamino)methylideneamino]imidazole-4-carboxamide isomerase [Candidatus Omnitrophica bacterium]|nr:1-(5-phosphoribosyl)-5-[(5-phosphoribosylamino)methylideneamino]imidazole-4-carboxamide isomerase [Candidatus Omnitrophota bacterium]